MRPVFTAIFAIVLFSCTSGPDLAKEEKGIQQLLQQERKAHFEKDVALFMSEFADSMLSVNNGKVTVSTFAGNKERIRHYFESVKFIKWDDLVRPVIRFAADASLAYALVQKEVIVSYPDTLHTTIFDTTHFAWVSIYRKQKGEWKLEANISTKE